MKGVLTEVLKEIKPSGEEEDNVKAKIDSILKNINSSLKGAKAILGGSGIKGTWLKKANDADIFVRFNYKKYKERSEELSKILEKHLKRKFKKLIMLHGSRDYFQIKEEDFTTEIIPILEIKKAEDAKNITDVSPLHAEWVNKKGKKFKDDIRLLKQFCKAAGVYGAESYIHGFSGYICEILTIYYKGFPGAIRNISKWKEKVIIDIEGYWKGKNILMELNKSKTLSPLIVIDPVQADRNAAAAISREKFERLRQKAKEFIKNPSKKFFEIEEITEDKLKKKAGKNQLIILNAKPKKAKEDVAGCRLIKIMDFIKKELEDNDFKVLDHGLEWGKKENALFYFIIKKEKLSEFIEGEGPPLSKKMHVENFRKKHKDTFIKNNRIYAKIKRTYLKAENLIKELKKDSYLKDKIEEIR